MQITHDQFRFLVRAWTVVVAILLAILLAMTVLTGWRAYASPDAATGTPGVRVLLTAARQTTRSTSVGRGETAAPARGVTGTTALPTMPVAAAVAEAIVAGEPIGIVAARPFSLGRASAIDRGRAVQCLTNAIYYEAASEPDAGQRAVAQVILNRVRHPAFPATVCGVVYQGSERAGCQFSFACDGALARAPSRDGWARAARTAAAALAGYVYAPVGLATHYHTYAVTPGWNRGLVMTGAVGTHFFHRWKGFWGTTAAFSQRYRGQEPAPEPHDPLALPTLLSATVPVTTAGTALPVPPVSVPTITGTPRADTAATPPATAAAESGSGDILPRWKDAGQPLDQ